MAAVHSPPDGLIATTDPWITRFHQTSQLLRDPTSTTSTADEYIHTRDQEVYGEPGASVAFRIGNGGAGYTGVLRALAEAYLATLGTTTAPTAIAWVSNHSRHSQVALLADVVQVALTYEPDAEALSEAEGWAERVGRVFHDHFIVVGPDVTLFDGADATSTAIESGIRGEPSAGSARAAQVLSAIAASHTRGAAADDGSAGWRFHTRGDGSATATKERRLWAAAGVDVAAIADWVETHPATPYEALRRANADAAFLLTDRATFLKAKEDGVIPSLRVHAEGGAELLNPCSAMVMVEALVSGDGARAASNAAARCFAQWLLGDAAQQLIRAYGRSWQLGKPLFTGADREEFEAVDRLWEKK